MCELEAGGEKSGNRVRGSGGRASWRKAVAGEAAWKTARQQSVQLEGIAKHETSSGAGLGKQ